MNKCVHPSQFPKAADRAGQTVRRLNADNPPQRVSSRLAALLLYEGRLRQPRSRDGLGITITTGLKADLIPGLERVFLFQANAGGALRLTHASDVAQPDRDAPAMQCLEKAVGIHQRAMLCITTFGKNEFLQSGNGAGGDCLQDGPAGAFFTLLPIPLRHGRDDRSNRQRRPDCILLLETDRPLETSDPVLLRIADACNHALTLFQRPSSLGHRLRQKRTRITVAAMAALGLLACVPVPFSALAPAEIVAADPFIVASPLDGIIHDIVVPPNATIKAGDLLFTFDDTELAGRRAIARETLSVARAREQRLRQAAFSEPAARRELAEAEAARQIAEAELQQAENRLARTRVLAQRGGTVLYSRPDHWIGRPVSTGERIMEIADPRAVKLHADLPVGDAIVLDSHPSLRFFVEGQPFRPVAGKVLSAGYRAEVTPDQRLAYKITAELSDKTGLRIGMRGTAQLLGKRVALGYYLLRRPIAALRQRVGL
ncbi:efflux RND transporter periplasmic adaptor subunit [Notoacmeibacter ruber]|uniref:HlyD family efflux transporter periplasmic adaptor subunit n=1 Tax=Notoacmeibacter ruber TaxID=2670375 RepID=A0A3L7JBV1_9HYPH|nr:HlyD family efflux transporter periplasmic adaptor subunit [Notoacmeibacter ruber]RLQ88116.1 HlyD family efflux transporter periplasmic adaptor subunit [Notoacmeibacter ruber]